jgi:hypothetical protein
MVQGGSREPISIVGTVVEPSVAHAIRSALVDYPGSWNVHVDHELVGGWWLVTLSAEGFHHAVLVPPREQSPERLPSVVSAAITTWARPVHLSRCPADPPERRQRPRPADPSTGHSIRLRAQDPDRRIPRRAAGRAPAQRSRERNPTTRFRRGR